MSWSVRVAAVSLSLLAAGASAAEGPRVIAPGGGDEMAVVVGRCPTFHWTGVDGAQSVDLVVYRVALDGAEAPPERVLSLTLPGAPQGWTPSLGKCLEPGGRYAWSVGVGGEWSRASLFEISAVPSIAEVEEALAVLARYRNAEVETEPAQPSVDDTELSTVASGGEPEASRPPREAVGAAPTFAPVGSGGPPAALRSEGGGTPGLSATPSLTVDDQIHLGPTSDFFRDGSVWLWGSSVNTALGDGALATTTGSAGTAVGTKALNSNTTGFGNTAIGNRALYKNTDGGGNTAAGNGALSANLSGSRNTAVGDGALNSNTSGERNTAVGYGALEDNTEGDWNTAVGLSALEANTTGSYNTALGFASMTLNTEGIDNTAIGGSTMRDNTTGSQNTAAGDRALFSNTTGNRSVAIGHDSLFANTSGFRNVAVGGKSLDANTDGERNTAVGDYSLSANSSGDRNTAMGVAALYKIEGNRNIGVGNRAGYNTTAGSDNIFIGNPGEAGDTALIKIGIQGTQTATYIAGIQGATVAGSLVYVSANGQLGQGVSSRRYKTEIADLGDVSEELLDLRPVSFRYLAGLGPDGVRSFGLVAEEVSRVLPELVIYDQDQRPLRVRYHLLSSLLLNQLQEEHRQNRLQWALIGLLLVGLGVVAWTLRRSLGALAT